MDIPYTVSARPDTGLWNAKLGIWLFLASEVMLFGGLFSGYVFLRMGVTEGLDNPWPARQLPILPGFINTLVLIASSVFVVLAWSEVKMRNYAKYQFWMRLVVACALIFMGIKSYEYYGKFTHHGMKFEDDTIVEGVLKKDSIDFDVTGVTVNVGDDWLQFVDDLEKDSGPPKFKIAAAQLEALRGYEAQFAADYPEDSKGLGYKTAVEGEFLLTKSWMKKMQADGDAYDAVAKRLKAEAKAKNETLVLAPAPRLIALDPVSPLKFQFEPGNVKTYSAEELTYRDSAKIRGQLTDDKIKFEVHDLDLRLTADQEHSTAWKYLDEHIEEAFFAHQEEVIEEEAEGRLIKWTEKHPDVMKHVHGAGNVEAHDEGHGEDHGYPMILVDRADKKFLSNHGPGYSTYYAIYFTMTGLHGLHVLAGGLVLTYFLFCQKKLYKSNPEHLANRVEVGGLFWHFVDLVWIFLFPIMYLM